MDQRKDSEGFLINFPKCEDKKGRDGWGLKDVSSQTFKKKNGVHFFFKLSLFLLTLIMGLKYFLLGLLTIKLLICSPSFHLYTLEGIQHVQGKLNGVGHYLPPPWERSIYIKYLLGPLLEDLSFLLQNVFIQ